MALHIFGLSALEPIVIEFAFMDFAFLVLVSHCEHLVFLVFLADSHDRTSVFSCKSLVHAIFHDILESVKCMTVVCKGIEIV